MEQIEFDASGKVLGRLATEVANVLRGKNLATYQRNTLPDVRVTIKNVRKIKLSGLKLKQKKYYSFSGYPGGLKTRSAETMLANHPEKMFMLAVKRMLPDNKLRARALKHLTIE